MAKVMGINHVAFVVEDLEESIRSAVVLMGATLVMRFESLVGKYVGAVLQLGDDYVSYLHATDPSSFVAKHLQARGPGVQHIGLTIDDLDGFVEDLEKNGVRVDKTDMNDEKYKEALVGPKVGKGVVLQLMQWKDGPMDTTPEGKERLKRKYIETPGLRVIE